MYNVRAFGKLDRKERWVHPTNLWVVNRNAGYFVVPFNDSVTGAEYSAIRWFT